MIIFAVFTERGELKPPVVSGNVIVEDRDDTYKNGMATVHHRESGASQNTQAFMFSKGQWHCYAVTAQLCMLSGQPKICRPLCFLKVHNILSSSAMFVFWLWWNHLRTVSGCFVFKVSLMVSFQGQSCPKIRLVYAELFIKVRLVFTFLKENHEFFKVRHVCLLKVSLCPIKSCFTFRIWCQALSKSELFSNLKGYFKICDIFCNGFFFLSNGIFSET